MTSRPHLLLPAAALALLAVLASPGSVVAQDGRIIEAPGNIRQFSPDDDARVVDATDIDLRRVFEDLGADATLWYQHVMTLSNPFFEGRSAGTRGYERTLEYVEHYFRLYGLDPAFPEGEDPEADHAWVSYVQPFDYGSFPRLVYALEDPWLAIDDMAFVHERDFAVLGTSGGDDRVRGPVTFVGYAIEEGRFGYRSFDDDTDLSDQIVLMLRWEPFGDDGGSLWSDGGFTSHSRFTSKVRALTERGAAAIIMVNPPGIAAGAEGLETAETSAGFGPPLDVPFLQVTHEMADLILRSADPQRRSLTEWTALANQGLVRTVALGDIGLVVEGRVRRERERQQVLSGNVGGVLPGRGALADEWVVIGAHCDHVGMGRSNDNLHPGADDNASGTAGMLLMAKRMSERYTVSNAPADLRSILFMAFGAEEVGLLGSAHYCNHPTLSADDVSVMINMDMIGRLRDDTLLLGGTSTAEEFEDLLPPHVEASGLVVAFHPPGQGPSDHASFHRWGVPVLFAFTGLHDEYHRPGDHGYTVNPIGAVEVVDFIDGIAWEALTREENLTFRETGRRR